MVAIFFWIVGLSLFTLYYTWPSRKSDIVLAISGLSWAIGLYGIFLLFKNTILSGVQANFILGLIPLNLLVLFAISMGFIVKNYFKSNKFDEVTGGPILGWFFLIFGIFHIIGTLIFGYHNIQILTGIFYFILAALYFMSNRKYKYIIYQMQSVSIVLLLAGYFCLYCYQYYGILSPTTLRDTILSQSPTLLFTALFIVIGFSKYNLIKVKYRNKFAGIWISVMVAGILFFHPEIQIDKFPFFKDFVKYSMAGTNSGILSSLLAICLFKKPTII